MKKFWGSVCLIAVGLGGVVGSFLCIFNDMGSLGSMLLLLGLVVAFFGIILNTNAVAELKKKLEAEADEGVKTTRRQINKHIMMTVVVAVVVVCGLVICGSMLDAKELNARASFLLNNEYDTEKYNELLEQLEKRPLVRLFFAYEDELNAKEQEFIAAANVRAQEISKDIAALEPVTRINSEQHYSQLCAKISELALSDSSDFNNAVRERITNMEDLTAYVDQLEQLRQTYGHTCKTCRGKGSYTCGSCGGSGSSSCSSCGGSGKNLVTWYSHGNYGEKSYSSYACGACGGRGRGSCGNCSGGKADCGDCENGYYYIYEDGK